jgi:hypothetical protein
MLILEKFFNKSLYYLSRVHMMWEMTTKKHTYRNGHSQTTKNRGRKTTDLTSAMGFFTPVF